MGQEEDEEAIANSIAWQYTFKLVTKEETAKAASDLLLQVSLDQEMVDKIYEKYLQIIAKHKD